MSSPVLLWWYLLCAVSGLNLLVWLLSAAALRRRHAGLAADVYAARRLQLLMCSAAPIAPSGRSTMCRACA